MTKADLKIYLLDRASATIDFVHELQKLDDNYSEQRMKWLDHSDRLLSAAKALGC